jgi:sugar phosphate isomerase/epimerase
MARLGLMLYTVRDECADDLERTLREVASMGFEGVEVFDLYGHDAATVRGWLESFGLAACARHASFDAVESELPALAAEARALRYRRVVVSWIPPPTSAADADAWIERLTLAARAAAEHELELGFHNHDGELVPLEDGSMFVDRVIESPLFLELDLGWAWFAGVDPAELLGRTRGRVPLVHVKDFRDRERRSFTTVGDGAVGYDSVAPAAVDAGVEWLLVEQDETDGSALDAARRSLEALRAFLR